MKIPRISHCVGQIDDDLIIEAEEFHTPRSLWKKWIGLAACIVLLSIVSALIVPQFLKEKVPEQGKYRYQVSVVEAQVDWPWEKKTNGERYPSINFKGSTYNIKSQDAISEELLGLQLGCAQAQGTDYYTGKSYSEIFEVRMINGVSQTKLIAAGTSDEYYVYSNSNSSKPQTFGKLEEEYGLSKNLEFNQFTDCRGYTECGHYCLTDDQYIWQILSQCTNAPLCDEIQILDRSNRNYYSFTATSPALGIYKRVVYISEDGYFATNIFDYSYVYQIGKEAAENIISYAKNNSSEVEPEPYDWTISGTITEISEGYFLVDDTILCKNESDGTTYKILVDDVRIRRYVERSDINVGEIVVVRYRGKRTESNEIYGADAIYKGVLVEGNWEIPE